MSLYGQRRPRRLDPPGEHGASLLVTLGFMVVGLMLCAAYGMGGATLPQQDETTPPGLPM